MNACASSSERGAASARRDPSRRSLLAAWALVLVAGCAARQAGSGGRVVPYEPAGELALETEDTTTSSATAPLLPGAERLYPSQEPRNAAPPGAPEAFPLTGESGSGGTAPQPAGEASGPPASETAPQPPVSPGEAEGTVHPVAPPPAPSGTHADPDRPEGGYTVQLFASSSAETAGERARALARYFEAPVRVVASGGIHRVRLGPFADRDSAEVARRRAAELGVRDAFLVPPDANGAGGR